MSALALLPLPAFSDDSPDLLSDSFNVALGSFIINTDTVVRLDGDLQQGTEVDWENTFGSGDVTRFRVDGY